MDHRPGIRPLDLLLLLARRDFKQSLLLDMLYLAVFERYADVLVGLEMLMMILSRFHNSILTLLLSTRGTCRDGITDRILTEGKTDEGTLKYEM